MKRNSQNESVAVLSQKAMMKLLISTEVVDFMRPPFGCLHAKLLQMNKRRRTAATAPLESWSFQVSISRFNDRFCNTNEKNGSQRTFFLSNVCRLLLLRIRTRIYRKTKRATMANNFHQFVLLSQFWRRRQRRQQTKDFDDKQLTGQVNEPSCQSANAKGISHQRVLHGL